MFFDSFHSNPVEDLFKRLNLGLPIFDLVFFSDFHVDDEEVPVPLLKGKHNEYLSYSDLPTCAKAEA
jgi:hypothetical protein